MKAISGLTSMFDSLTKVVVSLLALGIAVSLLGGNVPFVGEIASNIIGLVQSLGDATVVVPLIKEYMEISVKNDDALIKMAAIVQRLSTGTANSGDGGLLTEEEMAQLQEITEEIAKTVESEPKQLDKPNED